MVSPVGTLVTDGRIFRAWGQTCDCYRGWKFNAKTRPKPSGAEKTPATNGWSPLVLDALYKVVVQHDFNSDMSLEDVQKMVLKSKRLAVRVPIT